MARKSEVPGSPRTKKSTPIAYGFLDFPIYHRSAEAHHGAITSTLTHIKSLDGASKKSTGYLLRIYWDGSFYILVVLLYSWRALRVSWLWQSCLCSVTTLPSGYAGVRDTILEAFRCSIDGREAVQARWFVHGRGELARSMS